MYVDNLLCTCDECYYERFTNVRECVVTLLGDIKITNCHTRSSFSYYVHVHFLPPSLPPSLSLSLPN